VAAFNGVQRVGMTNLDVIGDRNTFSKEKSSSEDKSAEIPAFTSQKEEKSKFDITSLEEKDKKKLDDELKKMNESLASSGKMLKFKFNDDAKTTYVEVIDSKSQEVIASLPPEFLIDLSVKMKELIGMFLDERR